MAGVTAGDPSWSKHVADVLRRNGIRMFATVPDSIVTQVLEHLGADAACRVVTVTREEEGVGLLAGAFLAGARRRPPPAKNRPRQPREPPGPAHPPHPNSGRPVL